VTGKITREDTLLDWKESAVVLERKIRSLQPRPAAFTTLMAANGEEIPLKVHSAIVCRKAQGPCGTILKVDERGVLMACAEGALLLGTIQPEGKGRMHSSAFARGRELKIGS